MLKALVKFLRHYDWTLIAACVLASLMGMILVISAVNNPPPDINPSRLLLVQAAAVFLGFAAMMVIALFDYRLLKNIPWILAIFGVAVLVFTGLFAPEISGNRSWLNIGITTIQPSEFIKLLYIVTLAAHIDYLGEDISKLKNFLLLLLHAGSYIGAVLLQKDMGMALIYILIFVIMVTAAGLKARYYAVAAVLVTGLIPVIWMYILGDRQRFRILTMFDPELDPLGYGYQVIQSKTAIGSGGFFGAGYMNGVLTQNGLLPAKPTDFIFSVCGEEFGFVGCIVTVVVLGFIVGRIFRNTKLCNNTFGKMILIGISGMLFAQCFINIGMCLGLTPVIGITLPFFSAGGSSMLSVWLAVGLAMSVIRNRRLGWQEE